jgi:hypothetical protein
MKKRSFRLIKDLLILKNRMLNQNKKRNLYKKMEITQKVLKAFGFFNKKKISVLKGR